VHSGIAKRIVNKRIIAKLSKDTPEFIAKKVRSDQVIGRTSTIVFQASSPVKGL